VTQAQSWNIASPRDQTGGSWGKANKLVPLPREGGTPQHEGRLCLRRMASLFTAVEMEELSGKWGRALSPVARHRLNKG